MSGEYFIVLGIALLGPLIFSFSRALHFYRSIHRLILALALPLPLFLGWDVFATARGHWSFHPRFITGLMIGNLPLEEVLFFIVIPFCALFTWEVVKHYSGKRDGEN